MLAVAGNAEQTADSRANSEVEASHKVSVYRLANDGSKDAVVDWTNPVSKQRFKVNARTGVVLPERQKFAVSHITVEREQETENRQPAGINTSLSSKSQPLSLARRPASSRQNANSWLPGFLKDWNNPVFVQQREEQIPAIRFSFPDMGAVEAERRGCMHESRIGPFTETDSTRGSYLTKSALKEAKVVRQVDSKYILCKTKSGGSNRSEGSLILVDQHAASERVILEKLLNELCSPLQASAEESRSRVKTTCIKKPLRFQISETEYRLFHDHARHFADWGILYQLADKEEVLDASQVRAPKREFTIVVQYLPPGIAERCVLVPKLLIELLRSEVWSIAESAKRPQTRSNPGPDYEASNQEHAWLKRIGSCPRGILDMLNSRACRSAIMFNDGLSILQCQQLISDLSKCAFPFMCAHGRVSMVPLVEAGNIFGDGTTGIIPSAVAGSEVESFTKTFRKWKDEDGKDRSKTINRFE